MHTEHSYAYSEMFLWHVAECHEAKTESKWMKMIICYYMLLQELPTAASYKARKVTERPEEMKKKIWQQYGNTLLEQTGSQMMPTHPANKVENIDCGQVGHAQIWLPKSVSSHGRLRALIGSPSNDSLGTMSPHPKWHLDLFIRSSTARACDQQTDRQTDRQTLQW